MEWAPSIDFSTSGKDSLRRGLRPRAWSLVAVAVAVVASACSTLAGCSVASAHSAVSSATKSTVQHDATGVEGGLVPDDASPFDTDLPAIANLDSDLRHAVQDAARDAEADGITFRVTSGWRSTAFQQQLLDRAVTKYGSEAEALRYVSTPDRSRHVPGLAVDIGPTDADDWLSRHGAEYGLCRTYANEMWHFELATSPGGECPEMSADATQG